MTTTTARLTTAYRSAGRKPTGHYETRDEWILAAINKFWRPALAELGVDLPEAILISVGFAPGQRAGSTTQASCYLRAVSGGLNTVFVTPEVDDLVQMLRIIGHELIHVADDTKSGHRAFFAETAYALGYVTPLTDATFTMPELTALLERVAADLGPFGHHKRFDLASRLTLPINMPLRPHGHGGQGNPGRIPGHGGNERNRWRKVTCETKTCNAGQSGYKARITRLWALEHGTPKCPECDRHMILEIKPEDLLNDDQE